jgi:hypothetical protein
VRISLAAAASLAFCTAMMVSVATCGRAHAESPAGACGPFGDPPATILGPVKPTCGSGELLGPWKDGDGTDRYACLHEPTPAKPGRRLALLVYLHPSLFGTWTITHTNLLDLQRASSSSGGPASSSFIVLAPQGRNTTHYYQWPDNRGMGWDNWYRQLSPGG